jgi:hypothetical protein
MSKTICDASRQNYGSKEKESSKEEAPLMRFSL